MLCEGIQSSFSVSFPLLRFQYGGLKVIVKERHALKEHERERKDPIIFDSKYPKCKYRLKHTENRPPSPCVESLKMDQQIPSGASVMSFCLAGGEPGYFSSLPGKAVSQ